MPRGFSERERERIREGLLEQGQTFLGTYGVKKTNVEDLTRTVGISKGAFYLFYDSKEELFYEVLARWEDEYHDGLLGVAVRPGVAPRRQVVDFLREAFSVWKTHPLFTRFDPEEYEHLLRKLPEDKIEANLRKDEIFVGRLLDLWRDHGVELDCEVDLFLGLMRALFFVALHEEDVGRDAYPAVIEFFIGSIAQQVVQE
jgi:AcrR family transcriptional regulator